MARLVTNRLLKKTVPLGSAAYKGLTEVRPRSRDQTSQNFLQNGRQPQKLKGEPMPKATARANAKKSAVRAHVEHPFAHQKGSMGLAIRTIGIARTTATVMLSNMAYNMRRRCWLDRRSLPA